MYTYSLEFLWIFSIFVSLILMKSKVLHQSLPPLKGESILLNYSKNHFLNRFSYISYYNVSSFHDSFVFPSATSFHCFCVIGQQIDAHQSPLAAMAFSSNGTYLATASQKGTIIRVYLVAQATKSHSFRRGTYPSMIYSLSFGPSNDLPDVLLATSLSGSLHMFFLDAARNRKNQTNKLLSSIIPGAITDALDPANHHIIHNVIPAEIKSCLAVPTVENSQNSCILPALRTVVYIITHDGYFREYTISTTRSNESSWVLQREFNLLDTGYSTPQRNGHNMD
ncbi:hypothetical protein GUJ93_ZPchr0002g24135 [Zizania palustris]|uniref:Autophagy-related protein 18b n=1 Tax=Zizania palustris TaxID=103762 RepID=A0A8J5SJA4_ZIZPA|nr:hypothetical protein GUJ93_ZPchr0002g24135 [Zizania palustris]